MLVTEVAGILDWMLEGCVLALEGEKGGRPSNDSVHSCWKEDLRVRE